MNDKQKRVQALLASPSYHIAFKDKDFLTRENLRGTRLQLEYNKAEMMLNEADIQNTIVMFGSARTKPESPTYQAAYEIAHKVSSLCTNNTVLCSGGGPGIMQAVNHGAFDAGKKSIGLNIEIPHEQEPNQYISPDLCFNFHYFAIRKMHFLRRAKALIAFPGGFGTMDELFETLTLIQTKKINPLPIILFDQKWWENIINFQGLVEAKTISASDLKLFNFAQTVDEALNIIKQKAQCCLPV